MWTISSGDSVACGVAVGASGCFRAFRPTCARPPASRVATAAPGTVSVPVMNTRPLFGASRKYSVPFFSVASAKNAGRVMLACSRTSSPTSV